MSAQPVIGVDSLNWTLGDRIRKAREVSGFADQKEFAAAISDALVERGGKAIGQGALSKWERGTQPRDLIKVVGAIAEITGVPAEWILGFRVPKFGTRPTHLSAVPMPVGQQEFAFVPPVTLTPVALSPADNADAARRLNAKNGLYPRRAEAIHIRCQEHRNHVLCAR